MAFKFLIQGANWSSSHAGLGYLHHRIMSNLDSKNSILEERIHISPKRKLIFPNTKISGGEIITEMGGSKTFKPHLNWCRFRHQHEWLQFAFPRHQCLSLCFQRFLPAEFAAVWLGHTPENSGFATNTSATLQGGKLLMPSVSSCFYSWNWKKHGQTDPSACHFTPFGPLFFVSGCRGVFVDLFNQWHLEELCLKILRPVKQKMSEAPYYTTFLWPQGNSDIPQLLYWKNCRWL